MRNDVGRAGQAGYVLRKGESVILTPATNLPKETGIAYFAVSEDYPENNIGVSGDDVSLIVDYDDIKVTIKNDDWMQIAPWEDQCGYEHDTVGIRHYFHPGSFKGYNYVNRPVRDGGCLFIELDNKAIELCLPDFNGCSKQVKAEKIATIKRELTERLVDWYVNGWEWFQVCAECDDYYASLCGVDSYKYAEEVGEELRMEVAKDMESDGYIVENMPDQKKGNNQKEWYKRKLEYNMNKWYV